MLQRAVTALLGPTNTGKTCLAIERMLTHASDFPDAPSHVAPSEFVHNREA